MQKVGNIDPDLQFAMDYDLFIRMMEHGKFQHVHRFLAAFRNHPSSKTNTVYETTGKKEISEILCKHGINLHWYDRIIGNLFGQTVIRLGLLYFVTSKLLNNKRFMKRFFLPKK